MSGDRPKPPFLEKRIFRYCLELYHGWSMVDLPDGCSIKGYASFEQGASLPKEDDAFTLAPCRLLMGASTAACQRLFWAVKDISQGIAISSQYDTVALHHIFPYERLVELADQLLKLSEANEEVQDAITSYKRQFYKLYGEQSRGANPDQCETIGEERYLKVALHDMIAWNPGNLFTGPKPTLRLDDECKGMEGQHVLNASEKLFFAEPESTDLNNADDGDYVFGENLHQQIMQQDADIDPIAKLRSWTKVLSSGMRVGLFTFNVATDKKSDMFQTLGEKRRIFVDRIRRIFEGRGMPLKGLGDPSLFKGVFAALDEPKRLQSAVSALFNKLQLKDLQNNTAIFTFTSKKEIDPLKGEKSVRCKGLSAEGGFNEVEVENIAKQVVRWTRSSWVNTK